MQIKNQGSVWFATIATTFVALCIVAVAVFLIYPRELWQWEIKVGWTLTSMITIPATYLFAQNLRINFELSEELQRLVNRDRLTDVATRDFFFDKMERAPDAYGVSLMIDIDHFKNVNDTYGHYAGDEVIKHVSRLLRAECRGQDIVCRFGGEEFVIFLHHATGDQGLLVAERIRMSIEAAPATAEGVKISVTVSIGGSLKERMEDINISIKQADEALYRAKQAGRNRTIVNWMPSSIREISTS